MKNQWKNVLGKFCVELAIDDEGVLFDLRTDTDIPSDISETLKPYVSPEDTTLNFNPDPPNELVIDFLSSGHYESMSWTGGPHGRGYPEESSDERLLNVASIDNKPLPEELAKKLFHYYEESIKEVVLDYDS